jgi:hypothetical protein
MKLLLTITALLEAATGLALITTPTIVARLLLGAELSGVDVVVARVAGIALLSLGIACWPGCGTTGNKPPALWGMLTYNLLATLFFFYLIVGGQFVGPLLWPVALLHGGMTGWCSACLRRGR